MKQQAAVKTADVYQRITDFVIEQLEKGQVLWQKGWSTCGLPKNIVSGKQYRGWNIFLLNFITLFYEYKTPFFITYKQAMEMGGSIRRGQKGYNVIWWATIEDKSKSIEVNGEQEYLSYRAPKFHTVFNIDQTHGIEFPKVAASVRSITSKIRACDHVIEGMPDKPQITHAGDKAFYSKASDTICLPAVERFHSDETYYKTLFHELAHSTGHTKRLNRKELMESDGFAGERYSKEELTAELTASFLCAICEIEQQTIINSAAYIGSWLKVLQDDKRLILKAATQAQAAADYILNKKMTTTDEGLLINQ